MSEGEQRWRYEDDNGRPIWLVFDPNFQCVYCDLPVGALSYGGPAICPLCDCGVDNTNGLKWDVFQASSMIKKARARFNSIPYDPAWIAYEDWYQSNRRKDNS